MIKGLILFIFVFKSVALNALFSSLIILVYQSQTSNHLIAEKFFHEVLRFNIQLYFVLKIFTPLMNSKACELSENCTFQSITRIMFISFILNG